MTSTNTDEVSRATLLEQIHHLAFADAGALVDEEGLRPISMLSKEEAVALVSIEVPVRSGRGTGMTRPIRRGGKTARPDRSDGREGHRRTTQGGLCGGRHNGYSGV